MKKIVVFENLRIFSEAGKLYCRYFSVHRLLHAFEFEGNFWLWQ